MLYHKRETERGTVINELYDDEIITYCMNCNKEIEVTLEDIAHIHKQDGDFGGTSFRCVKCTNKQEVI